MEAVEGTVHKPFLYNATDIQLQEFLLLGLFVAGKNAIVQQHKLNWFLERLRKTYYRERADFSWFERLAFADDEKLEELLRVCRVGQYKRLTTALLWLGAKDKEGSLDLRTCSREELCQCPGLGLKTASFFLIYTREDNSYACLDTHILKWLKTECGYTDVPQASPSSKKQYAYWERIYLEEAHKRDRNPTELDFDIWLSYSQK